jgi:hypothetical protein
MNLSELKKLQLKIIKRNTIINIIFYIMFIIIFFETILYLKKTYTEISIYAYAFIFEVIILLLISTIIKEIVIGKDTSIFNKEFKRIFVYGTLSKIFENLTYNSNKGLEKSVIRETQMMSTGDRYSSNDFISGTYKGINFMQSDIQIEEKHDEKDEDGNKKTKWETIFLGRWMIFDFNKNFKANIQVSSSYFDGNVLSWNKNYQKISLEDIEFNKRFTVYAEDELEAFYILTPHFMEKIKNIEKQLNCEIMLCFINSKLHIAINNNIDSFEYNVLKKINEKEIETNIMKDIKLITDFVNELGLDNNLFGKEV